MNKRPTGHFEELWKQVCLDNDIKAFELLFYRLNQNLVLFCDTVIHNECASEEIVGDLFVYIWNNRSTLAHVENPKAYLYTGVKNRALNYVKKYSHLQLHVDLSNEVNVIDSTDPSTILEHKELFIKMEGVISKLPAQTLLVFRLIKEDGMKYKEVAELLHISPRTVQTHMRRAFQKIMTFLARYNKANKAMADQPSQILLLFMFLVFQ